MRTPTFLFFLGASAAATLLAGASCSTPQRRFGASTGSSTGGGAASSSSSGSGVSSSSSAGTGGSGGMATGGAGGAGTGGSTDVNCAVPGSPVDCTDPACVTAGFACTPAVPAGWQGPSVLYTGASPPPGCGIFWTESALTAGMGVTAPPATCSACTCGVPTGEGCATSAIVEIAQNPTCTSGLLNTAPLGACIEVGEVEALGVRAGPLPATGGTCKAAGGAPTVKPPTFAMQAALCAPETTGGGCTAGVCIPQVPTGYGSGVCIYQDGDVACPTGPYAQKTLLYSGFADDRSCSACACGAPSGGTCPASVLLFEYMPPFAGCAFPGPSLAANGTCVATGIEVGGFTLELGGAPSGGGCAASGGSPIGTTTATMPTTVCCE
jgi:hypothetical protein